MEQKPNKEDTFQSLCHCKSVKNRYNKRLHSQGEEQVKAIITFASRERLKILLSAKWALYSQMGWPFIRVLPGNLQKIHSKKS